MRRVRAQLPFHALVALVLTWPLAAHLGSSLPFGTEDVETVPLFNLWTLRWNQLQVGDLFRHYWDAPVFHPTGGAFALSEPQPLTGLFFTPIAWATRNPVLAYNVTLLAILTLNGFAAARLARRLGVAPWPAACAGVLAQSLPFVSNQLGVLQLTALFPLLLLADALVAWAPRGGRRAAVGIGGWLAASFLTCGYYGLFAFVVVGLASLTLVRRSWLSWARLRDVALAGAVFAVLTLPVVIGQARYTDPYTRSESTILGLSAMPVDFVRLHPDAHGASTVPWLLDDGGTAHYLYPGTALLLLAGWGLAVTLPRLFMVAVDEDGAALPVDDEVVDGRRRVLFLLNAALLAFLLSFGLRLDVGGFRPYDLLREHVPGYRNLRSPYRFAVLAEVFLVPLAALGLGALWSRRPAAGGVATVPRDRVPGVAEMGRAIVGRLGPIVAVALVVLGVAEVSPVPQRLFAVADEPVDWSTWLHDAPAAAAGDGSVAMVPFPADGDVGSYEATARWMLLALDHGHPLVNGYSGLFPASYDELEAQMRRFPRGDGLALLRQDHVSWVVIMRSWLTPARQADLSRIAGLTPAFEGRDAVVYQLS